MKILKYSIFILLVSMGAFLYFLPASFFQSFLPTNISVSGVSGTLWDGSARTIMIDKIDIQNTKWDTSLINLLSGKIKTDISINSHKLHGQFKTIYSNASLSTKDLALRGNLSILAPYFMQFGLTISGGFDANFKDLIIENRVPKKVNGNLNFYKTKILGVTKFSLGDVSSVFMDDINGLKIMIDNTNGDLDISGIVTINSNGMYFADLMLTRNSQTTDQVLQTAQLIGNKIDNNTVKFVHSGQISI